LLLRRFRRGCDITTGERRPKIFTVTFNADSGSPAPLDQAVAGGGKIAAPDAMTKDSYSFGGWYKEAAFTNMWNFESGAVSGNIILYAKWNPNPGALSVRILSGVSAAFRYVPAGSFRRDGTAVNVSVITKGFWMGETEVTRGLFQAVMGMNPGSVSQSPDKGEIRNKRPVECVNWYAAIAFCNKLSLAAGKTPVYSVTGISDWAGLEYGAIPAAGDANWNAATADLSKNGYRLPTEMEWMWAAMGADRTVQPNTTGYTKTFAGSTGANHIDDYAWYKGNSGSKTHEVGKKKANELGLKGMSGNVWEWCRDWYGSIPAGEQSNYDGPGMGASRVVRGGAWSSDASHCAVDYRLDYAPSDRNSNIGFRIVCGE
jgi:uncharacterized repeat protein (TIGR02543 family)